MDSVAAGKPIPMAVHRIDQKKASELKIKQREAGGWKAVKFYCERNTRHFITLCLARQLDMDASEQPPHESISMTSF